jgi:hypothetical protein
MGRRECQGLQPEFRTCWRSLTSSRRLGNPPMYLTVEIGIGMPKQVHLTAPGTQWVPTKFPPTSQYCFAVIATPPLSPTGLVPYTSPAPGPRASLFLGISFSPARGRARAWSCPFAPHPPSHACCVKHQAGIGE